MSVKLLLLSLSTTLLFTSCGESVQEALNDAQEAIANNAAPSQVAGALTGTAATGAPIPNAEVKVKCSDDSIKSDTTDAFGKWSIKMGSCPGPYLVQVKGTANGKPINLLSAADSEDVGKIVNVTPLTHVIAAQVMGEADADAAMNASISGISKANLRAEEDRLKKRLKQIIEAVTGQADMSKIDLMNQAFSTNHDGLDAVLDMVELDVKSDGSMDLKTFDGDTIIAGHDPSSEQIDDSEYDADEQKMQEMKQAYQSFDGLLDNFIKYVKANAEAIHNAADESQLPSGYQNFFSSTFKEEGNGPAGAMKQWFGLDDLNRFRQEMGDKRVAFENVKIKLDSADETLGMMFFDFIVEGRLAEKGINVAVKKENDQWRLNGNQMNFSLYAHIAYKHEIVFNGSQSKNSGAMLEISLDEGANLDQVRKVRISNLSNQSIATFDLTYEDYNRNGSQDSDEPNIISANGQLESHYHGEVLLDSTQLSRFSEGQAEYKIELLDSSDQLVDTFKQYLLDPNGLDEKFQSMTFINDSGADRSMDLSTPDVAEFCDNGDRSINLYPDFQDYKVEHFYASLRDDSGAEAREEMDYGDGHDSQSMTMSSFFVNGQNLSGNIRDKEFHFYLRDYTGIDYALSVRCSM